MGDEENKDQDKSSVASESVETPHPSQATGISKATKILVGITVVAILIAVIAVSMALNKDSDDDNQKSSNQGAESSQKSAEQDSGATAVSKKTKPIQKITIDEETELQLDSVKSQKNTLVLNFSYISTGKFDTDWDNPLYPDKLKDAYIVDDATNQKYEVITDANDNPLVSDMSEKPNYRIPFDDIVVIASFYVTVKAPPTGSTINIFVPGAQAFTGIKLNK